MCYVLDFTDIDECEDESLNDCRFECVNTIGNYTCNCPKDSKGDGRLQGDGCTRNSKSFVQIIVGQFLFLFFLLCHYNFHCIKSVYVIGEMKCRSYCGVHSFSNWECMVILGLQKVEVP